MWTMLDVRTGRLVLSPTPADPRSSAMQAQLIDEKSLEYIWEFCTRLHADSF